MISNFNWRLTYTSLFMTALFMSAILTIAGCESAKTPVPKPAPAKVWTNSIGMQLVHLPGGTFRMGDARFPDAGPVHSVTVAPFWIGQFEVTNGQYNLFRRRPFSAESPTNSHPATSILYSDAVKFCQWLSKKDGAHYRLPTEAEWEYAARGGLDQMHYPWGNEEPEGRATFGFDIVPSPVGKYAPNGFSLYDTAGNVREWVNDWYSEDYYSRSPNTNPKGPVTGIWKVDRGGSFGMFELYVGERAVTPPDLTGPHLGFRVVMQSREKPSEGPQLK